MSRVLLIGRGPLPAPDQCHTGFAQLRTAHFRAALAGAGHTVHTLLVERDEDPALLRRGRALARDADLVVSAGPHRPALVALEVAGERPLWIDLPGDPFAELDALRTAPGPPVPPARVAAVHALMARALSRADALSVISPPQRHALAGQLGFFGRRPPVAVVPISAALPLPPRAPRPVPATGPVTVALAGAFAPWFDDETLVGGLARALAEEPRLRLLCTGGGVAGHYTAGHERFVAWARSSPHRDRITLAGWVPHGALADRLAAAHAGLCLDRPGPEPLLGSRTRVLLFAHLGLHVLASPTTALVAELVAAGAATAVPPGPAALAATLRAFVAAPPPPSRAAAAARLLADQCEPATIAAPLCAFAAAPRRVAPVPDPRAAVAAELEAARAALAAVHASPTWRVLSRLHRGLRALRPG